MKALSPIVAVRLAPDAGRALTVAQDGTVRTWAGGAASLYPHTVPIEGGGPVAVALSGHAVKVLWGAEGALRLYGHDPGARPWQDALPAPAPVRAVALSPSGAIAVVACSDGTLHGLDVRTEEFGWTLATGAPEVRALTMASDDGPVVAAFADGTIRRYDLRTGTLELVGISGLPVHAVAVTADGAVVVTGEARGVLHRWDSRAGGSPQSRKLDAPVITAVAIDQTGDKVLAGGDNGRLWLQDFTAGPGVEYIIPADADPSSTEVAEAQPGSGSGGRSQLRPAGDDEPVFFPDDGQPARPDDDVRITVYRPPVLAPGRWARMLVFVHKTTPVLEPGRAPVDPQQEVETRARTRFGGAAPHPLSGDARAEVPQGARLRIVPELPGIRCNPPAAEIEWWEAVHEIEFRLAAGHELIGAAVHGAVRVWRGLFLLGDVSITIRVDADGPADESPPVAASARLGRKIFPSYSHKDRAVVEAVKAIVEAGGDDRYLMDVLDVRSGQRWEPRLQELIREADVFQLFWSHNSMRSPFCQDEWEYALALPREWFVRPVYWEQPLPEDPGQGLPPPALRELQFTPMPAAWVQPAAPASALAEPVEAGQYDQLYWPRDAPQQAAEPPRRAPRRLWAVLVVLLVVAIAVILAFQFLGR